ncbi:short chain dehydrogenase [Paenibacillus pini]|uniref:Short chain dehydrogenase n=1 Tax=Paenibacillus pini JCM 16418 TaxID=1236976 RepID=W7YSL5_9BACL|nr:short chain dehydrogenase [Paenibacillus pini]GAF07621.1 short chain dehydrogenase [Paenibacillus pini JCM 16418]
MKLLVIGANGTIGSHVVNEMKDEYEIIHASRSASDIQVDITSLQSIKDMYNKVGKIDAVVSATGATHFANLTEMTPELNDIGLRSKLAGQINLVLLGLDYINDLGSITLTTGILMDDPIVGGASSAMANGGIKAFVKSAALEMPRGIRINSVSPNLLEDSQEKYKDFFMGFVPVPGKRVGMAYRKSIQGAQTGQSYEVY